MKPYARTAARLSRLRDRENAAWGDRRAVGAEARRRMEVVESDVVTAIKAVHEATDRAKIDRENDARSAKRLAARAARAQPAHRTQSRGG